MAYQEVSRVEIREVLRRWQAGNSLRGISRSTGLSRATVHKYILAAERLGLRKEGPAPTDEQLTHLASLNLAGPRQVETPTEEVLEPWTEQIHTWLREDHLLLTRILELLAQRGCMVSYTSLRRFVHRRNWLGRSHTTVRMADTMPGETGIAG